MLNLEKLASSEVRRSRRNFVKVGAIATSALLASLAAMSSVDAAPPRPPGGPPGRSPPMQRHRPRQCFLKGTTIRTAAGDRKVEDLVPGDLLPTVFGGLRPIQWIGCYPFKKSDPAKAWIKEVRPVRIARSALAPEVPHTDLYVTQGHAVFIDGVLVPAYNLLNDITITLDGARALDELEFFHIKLEAHDVIYAEGAPCETLLDVDENAVNFADYFRQHGRPRTNNPPCAPRYGFGARVEIPSRLRSAFSPLIDRRRKLDVIRDRIEERALVL